MVDTELDVQRFGPLVSFVCTSNSSGSSLETVLLLDLGLGFVLVEQPEDFSGGVLNPNR